VHLSYHLQTFDNESQDETNVDSLQRKTFLKEKKNRMIICNDIFTQCL
jgi:hypothetical protein